MTRPKLALGVLAAACVGTLLWYAWLILAADLPRGAIAAAWALWLLSAAAVVSLVAYLREFLAHRQAVGREATWKPLPGLVLLWIGGLTALVSFAFVLPGAAGAAGAETPETDTTSSIAGTMDAPSGSAARVTQATSAARSTSKRLAPPTPVSTTAPQRRSATAASSSTTVPSTASTARSPGSSGHSSTGKPSPSSSTPLLGITIPSPPG